MSYVIRCCQAVAVLLLLQCFAMIMPSSAAAHEVRPAYLQIDQSSDTRYNVVWRTPILAGARLPVLLRFSDGINFITGPAEHVLPDSVIERSIIEAPGGLVGERISFVGLQASITDVMVRIKLHDGTVTTTVVRPSQAWLDIQPRQTFFQVAGVFTGEGIEHILFGLDHLLFVLALMLVVRSKRTLFYTITAFTLAHSITLTGATMGWVSLPTEPVEIMIAFSIALVATEIIALERGQTSLTIKAPWFMAFAFGLLHGFGFASALTDMGLPQGDIPLALLFFNVGVEIGQLLFVALLLVVVALLRNLYQIPAKAIIASAYLIGIVSAYWTLERIDSTFFS